jgi:allophanate hydrolase subunit 2
LREGDLLPLINTQAGERTDVQIENFPLAPPTEPVRVVLGPQDDYFTEDALATFLSVEYIVTREADRMGLRLDGPKLAHSKGANIVSDGIAPGAIQVPGNGLPIVLLADRQSAGGYPKIATVISADIPALGRVAPGQKLRFKAVTVEEAQHVRRQLEAEIAGLRHRLVPARVAEADLAVLLSVNLVSGVVDATSHASWSP